MADALRAQLTNGLPDTFRAGRFARVHGDMPPGVAGRLNGCGTTYPEAELIAGEVEGCDALAVGEQRRQLFLTGGFAEGAAQNTDQPGVDRNRGILLNPGTTASTTPSTGSRWVIAI